MALGDKKKEGNFIYGLCYTNGLLYNIAICTWFSIISAF